MPAFDPSNPMALFGLMSGMIPGMIPMTFAAQNQQQSRGKIGRCMDYDTKGFCAIGSACPYEHGGEIVLSPSADGMIFSSYFNPAN
jgi:hypothetical protein